MSFMDDSEKHLRRFVDTDIVYNRFIKGQILNPTDFELFCILNCLSIDVILKENQILKAKLNMSEEEIKRLHKEAEDEMILLRGLSTIIKPVNKKRNIKINLEGDDLL